MFLRFPVAGAWAAAQWPSAANDNPPGPARQESGRSALLREALRHVAMHGAGAAEHARISAEQAFFAGRRRDYLRWMAICRALDRRMIDAIGDTPPRFR